MAYELIFDSCNDLGPSYDKDNGVTIIPLAFKWKAKDIFVIRMIENFL